MKLKEFLKKYYGTNVKIGSGISYFYCGTITEENFETVFKKANKRFLDIAKKSIDTHTKALANADTRTKKAKASKSIKKNQKYIDDYVNLENREVKQHYEGILKDEPNTTIIIVTGREKGDYWTIREYKHPETIKRRRV